MYYLWPKETADEPYFFCDLRADGRLTMKLVGTFAGAKPDEEARYVETPSFRAHRLGLANPKQYY